MPFQSMGLPSENPGMQNVSAFLIHHTHSSLPLSRLRSCQLFLQVTHPFPRQRKIRSVQCQNQPCLSSLMAHKKLLIKIKLWWANLDFIRQYLVSQTSLTQSRNKITLMQFCTHSEPWDVHVESAGLQYQSQESWARLSTKLLKWQTERKIINKNNYMSDKSVFYKILFIFWHTSNHTLCVMK